MDNKENNSPLSGESVDQTEDIRQTHYDAWAKTKKWIEIEINELEGKTGWIGRSIPKNVDDPSCVVYRDTRQQTISALVSKLNGEGVEVSNIAKIYGL